jgi:GTP-binding protein Era
MKSAFVAVIGRPSAGKSTLLNAFCKQKVAIVSAVPQTTRNAIRGIVNREQGQLVFVDTPGRHVSEKKLNRKLQGVADKAMGESDLILYVLDATRRSGAEEEAIAALLEPLSARVVVGINKMDVPKADLEGTRAFVREKLPQVPDNRILFVSALEKKGMEELLGLLFDAAPEGQAQYPEDTYTDQDVQFRISEIIREKAINFLRDELPHAIYVDVADVELKEAENRLWVRAFIIVERESQKGIVVGKGGAQIKAIRVAAQKDLNRIFDWKVELDLRVKASHDWRQNDTVLKRLIDRG